MDEISSAKSAPRITADYLDYLFFLRPMLHPPVWTIVILGYFFAPAESASAAKLLILLILSSTAAGWAYIVNQISDIESDRLNKKLYFLPLGIISIRAAYVMAGAMLCITLVGGFLVGLPLLFAVGLVLGYLYSGRPFNAKNHPVAGLLVNGIAHGPLVFLIGFTGSGGAFSIGLAPSLSYFFAVTAVFIGTTIPDIGGDARTGKITPGVALGFDQATIVMTISLAISIILSIFNHDLPLTITAALSAPFFMVAIIKTAQRWALISIKISILLLSAAACIKFWPYTVILTVLLIVTRLYYRRRFGLTYPSI